MGDVAYGDGRQALLEAAIRVVAREGLRGLTYRAVAAEAGVSHGSVRYHFGDRARLVEEALAYVAQRSTPQVDYNRGEVGIQGFGNALVNLVEEDPEIQAFQYELELEARRRPDLVPTHRNNYAAYAAALEAAMRNRGDFPDSDLVEVLVAAFDGLVLQRVLLGDSDRFARLVRRLEVLADEKMSSLADS